MNNIAHSHNKNMDMDDHSNHHQMMAQDFKKRFLAVLPPTLFVLALSSQVQKWLGFSFQTGFNDLLLFILASAVFFYGGKPFFTASLNELRNRNYGMMTLVSLAIGVSYIFSVASTFLINAPDFYWEMTTLILAFLFGHWMEMRAVAGTGGALKELAKLIPPSAHKIEGLKTKHEAVVDIETDELKKGDFVLVKPGEKIPADGEVLYGESSVNESAITGESRPVSKGRGDEVIGGTINGDGSLTIKITKTGKSSAISQIMDLVAKAQDTKPRVQKLADKAANYLTLAAILVGLATFLYWGFATPNGFVFALTLAVTVIVITCPHALGLAIPVVTTITSSLAAKNGILIRDMRGLETAKNLDFVVFDKTGTLTLGNFTVTKVLPARGVKKKKLMQFAASVEQNSEHSIAKGIVNWVKAKKIKIPKARNFKAIKGKGAKAKVGRNSVVLGNSLAMKDQKIKFEKVENEIGTVVYVARNNKFIGSILLSDEIRSDSKKTIEELHKQNIKVAMLTGDKSEVAEEVGKELKIDTVFSDVLPKDKLKKVKDLQDKGNTVAMVGDGVNDAPSLTQANVGIAIGAGTSVAIESAEIVLVKNNPLDILKVINLSKKTDSKMKQNLAWATGYNLIAIPAAAGALSSFGIFLRPQWGALIMSASSIIVVLNALRLRRLNLETA